ncbi:Lcl C-terminal domain-containing protein [Dongshaea marina]|uniref:Lcl C-terminal domain-containing protein n=1 Tax=Dongshaea marina TaxID=2047966 RepID=UPI000D3EDBD2|nr:DUF1566 domain-containing protein [Dongshaea marina]
MKRLSLMPVIFTALLTMGSFSVFAVPRNGPPEAAVQACQGASQWAACQFTTPRGELQGRCHVTPQGKACVPDTHRRGAGSSVAQLSSSSSRQVGRVAQSAPGGKWTVDNPIRVESRVVDTNQSYCFDNQRQTPCPKEGAAFYGQDAQYLGAAPAYHNNGDGTVTDEITGLTWQKAHNATRLGFYQAEQACQSLTLGGHDDWRLPNIKELFSLADFSGSQGEGRFYINSNYFDLALPDKGILKNDRFKTHRVEMMGQTWSSTIYSGKHWGRDQQAAFFFNFFDAHLKQAPTRGQNKLFYRCVRGKEYGANQFKDLSNGTVLDKATGLTWQQKDDGKTRNWQQALAYCEALKLADHSDWRLPNVKELQSIVDYQKNSPAIDERYLKVSDPKGWFWSSTTHGDNIRMADYVCFGACTSVSGVDTHGAGAQRSDPKVGDPKEFSSLGGQQDAVRIDNYVRCVRG